MANDDPMVQRALARLRDDGDSARNELVNLAVDHAFALPLRELVDLERLRALVAAALTEANVARIVERHVRAGWERYARAASGSDARLASLVPTDAQKRIREIARALRLPKARWARGAVDPALVRKLLAPVWTQVLVSFARRLPIPGLGASEGAGKREGAGVGVAGFLARSVQQQAEKLIDRGRNAMGGLGAEVERRLLEAARGFSDTAAETFRDALRARVQSDEGRELLAQISDKVVERVLDARLAELQQDADQLPLDPIFAVAPQIVAHAAATDYVIGVVRGEIDAYLALEGDRSLHAVLDELGVLAPAQDAVRQHAHSLAKGLVESPAFAAWWSRLFSE
jgi:hypothetical protein